MFESQPILGEEILLTAKERRFLIAKHDPKALTLGGFTCLTEADFQKLAKVERGVAKSLKLEKGLKKVTAKAESAKRPTRREHPARICPAYDS